MGAALGVSAGGGSVAGASVASATAGEATGSTVCWGVVVAGTTTDVNVGRAVAVGGTEPLLAAGPIGPEAAVAGTHVVATSEAASPNAANESDLVTPG